MDRTIKPSEIKAVVETAYNKYKDFKVAGAAPDPRVSAMNPGKMSVSVCLTDGTRFGYGDTEAAFAIGSMMRIPMYIQLYSQMSPHDLVHKMGKCGISCHSSNVEKPTGLHVKSLRLASLIEPTGDSDGKMAILSDLMISLMGSSPVLDDAMYKANVKANIDNRIENRLAEAGYELYDNATVAIDIVNKLNSMLVTTAQLAEMGATIASDGMNPASQEHVFDSKISESIVAMIAAKGPKSIRRPWLMITGVPAISSFGGGLLAVIPGFGAIATFSPELVNGTIPYKAAFAMKEIVTSLDLNVFASSRVRVAE